ncbi:MAG: hypothetical protein MHM6MM_001504 [Cercozoa sp. M6MM]
MSDSLAKRTLKAYRGLLRAVRRFDSHAQRQKHQELIRAEFDAALAAHAHDLDVFAVDELFDRAEKRRVFLEKSTASASVLESEFRQLEEEAKRGTTSFQSYDGELKTKEEALLAMATDDHFTLGNEGFKAHLSHTRNQRADVDPEQLKKHEYLVRRQHFMENPDETSVVNPSGKIDMLDGDERLLRMKNHYETTGELPREEMLEYLMEFMDDDEIQGAMELTIEAHQRQARMMEGFRQEQDQRDPLAELRRQGDVL